jgi:hypothetical protein
MTAKTLRTRRAVIVRRWAAFKIGRSQREVWARRHAAAGDEATEESAGDGDLLAELPDTLLG